MTGQLRVNVSSPPHRERLVSDIMVFEDGQLAQFAEINQDEGYLQIELYPRRDGKWWLFKLDELLLALTEARRRLGENSATKGEPGG
jgi:hypothetical protein